MAMPKRAELTPDDPRHGSESTYVNAKCRCEACRAAHAAAQRDRRRATSPPPPGDPRHGTDNTYVNHRCRCELCTRAHRKASQRWRVISGG